MHLRQKVLPNLLSDKRNPLSPNVSSTNFIYIKNSPIPEEDLKIIFDKYPPLEDGITVELRQCVEYEINNQRFDELSKFQIISHL